MTEWLEDAKKGGIVTDLLPFEMIQISGEEVTNRPISTLFTRISVNIGKASETAAKVMTAPLGGRPRELLKQIKIGVEHREAMNDARIKAVQRNVDRITKFRPLGVLK